MRILIHVLFALLISLSAAAEEPLNLDTDDKRALYTWGVMLAMTMKGVDVTPEEAELVITGFRDMKLKGELALVFEEQQQVVKTFVAERTAQSAKIESARSQGFIAERSSVSGAETTESGLIYLEEKAGAGESPESGDTVKVHYHGTLVDGKVFDSSRERGTPSVFRLAQTIPCWQEAILRMKEGGSASITCPASIAYGDRGMGVKIPGGATLHFEVELISIE